MLLCGDSLQVLRGLDSESVQCCVTSPPYWGLRDYGAEGQFGLEKTPDEYVAKLVAVFAEVKRVLKNDGTLWLVLGDSYAGGSRGGIGGASTLEGGFQSQNQSRAERVARAKVAPGLKPKDLVGIPWLVAFALRSDGWWLRSEIIWHKPSCMPFSGTDRPTTAHESIFLLAKSSRYFYDAAAIEESVTWKGGPKNKSPVKRSLGAPQNVHKIGARETKNKRSVWKVSLQPYKGAHFATYPPKLIRPCILAGSRPGDTILDPFNGAGTTGLVAIGLGREYIGIDINPEYLELTRKRLAEVPVELFKRGLK